MYSRSAAMSPYDGASWRRAEYTCNESFASRTVFLGPTGGNMTDRLLISYACSGSVRLATHTTRRDNS
jgi:hypothetical protein